MRQLQITAIGEPADVLELVEFQAPAPGPGQLLVEVQGRHHQRLGFPLHQRPVLHYPATTGRRRRRRGSDLVRLEAACAVLIDGVDGLDAIAERCGIGTGESLRRLFRRELGMTPSAYRTQLKSPGMNRFSRPESSGRTRSGAQCRRSEQISTPHNY